MTYPFYGNVHFTMDRFAIIRLDYRAIVGLGPRDSPVLLRSRPRRYPFTRGVEKPYPAFSLDLTVEKNDCLFTPMY